MSLMFGKARTCNIVTVPEHEPSECNIVILGANGSGKSDLQEVCLSPAALTVKFLTKRFISEYDPNLDTYSSEEVVDQQPVLVKVMDTADQDGPVNCERYLGWANAFIIVYSIDNRTSFEACQQYLEAVTLYSKGLQPEGPVILLGNKVDMERYRQVSKADGAALALRFGCLFFEVSACLDFLSVQQIFHEAVREVRRETERSIRPLFISEDKSAISLSSAPPLTTCYKELPTPATAKLVTVKSSRAQSKRRAPTLTLLKGFKIF
ncbi:ras-like protein family member 12 isoform X2 [Carassius auratus]|uniref:small monomeric GTPase n=1 Tax=Carassius auratus TaxID=7957 RepID=A0A6P6PM19_CARAU|nr:ras-like protein family member 12 isoform X2 [Carassius auratus]XP_052418025.1 ras-like protein family member 12 isoform X2 [Carassius gibelio]